MFLIYQKLLSGDRPYMAVCNKLTKFQMHRHPEVEFIYCKKGGALISINGKEYKMNEGELAVIGSMVSHSITENSSEGSLGFVAEIGPVLFGNYFEALAKVMPDNPVIKISQNGNENLYNVLQEMIYIIRNNTEFSELLIKGNLYKLGAYVLEECRKNNLSGNAIAKFRTVANIEKAYESIYENYGRKLSVDEVAALCGYSKSNFCKIFKNITGETFHNVLNKYRVQKVCEMLKQTDYSVEDIAGMTGFSDTKALCRTFKAIVGMTAGEYRKEN